MKNRLRELREQRGLTQQRLSELLNISRQTVISLESGRYNPSIVLAHRIAATFGLIIEQVFLFDGEE